MPVTLIISYLEILKISLQNFLEMLFLGTSSDWDMSKDKKVRTCMQSI